MAVSSKLKQRHIPMIALGGAIGGGLFVGSSSAMAEAGPGALLAFAATGLFVMAVMTMLGAELGTVAAGDSASPQQPIARVTYSVGLRICSFYLCSLLLILLVTPWRDVMPGHSPFLSTLARIGVPHTVMIMQCVVLVIAFSAVTFLAVFSRAEQRATVVFCFLTVLFFLAIYAIRKQPSCRRANVWLRDEQRIGS